MLKSVAAITLTVLTALTIVSLPSHAQSDSTQASPDLERFIALNRAKNLARMAAERSNGGLGFYRAERSMHGPADDSPYVDNGNGTWTFTFKGGQPNSTTLSVESVVTVSRDGSQVTVDYNGPVRSTGQ